MKLFVAILLVQLNYPMENELLLDSQLEPCAICFEEVGKSETHTTPCNHTFCKDCIKTWIGEKPTPNCPMCRKQIPNPLLQLNAALRNAAATGEIDQVNQLLKLGAKPNSVDVVGKTALHFAAESPYGQTDSLTQKAIMEILLEKGAKVDKTDSWGRTALHAAILFHGEESVVSFLLAKQAIVNTQDLSGETPLLSAVRQSRKEKIVSILLEKGAEVNAADQYGWTALHIAATSIWGNEKLVDILLEKGAEVNLAAEDGVRPLHLAAKHGNESIARVLLAKNANINAQDDQGRTSLHLAAYRRTGAKMVQMLLAEGANATLKTKAGKTARDLGCWSCQYALRHYDWVEFGRFWLF